MREELKSVFGKEVVLEDGTVFIYTVQPHEIKNMLGSIAAVLDEYFFTKKGNGEIYKLYRTTDGNWYDLEKVIDAEKSTVLRSLKAAFSVQIGINR